MKSPGDVKAFLAMSRWLALASALGQPLLLVPDYSLLLTVSLQVILRKLAKALSTNGHGYYQSRHWT